MFEQGKAGAFYKTFWEAYLRGLNLENTELVF